MQVIRVVKDQEIGVRIWMQVCDMLDAMDMPDKKDKDAFQRVVVEIMKKLDSCKYHYGNLERILAEAKVSHKPLDGDEMADHVDLASGAESEVESFLFQGKSCLDVLAKILHPIARIKLISFKDSGKGVIKALENNTAAEKTDKTKALIELIREDQEWIGTWFKSERDVVTHFRSVRSSGIPIKSCIADATKMEPRHPSGVIFVELLRVLYENLLSFCVDFLVLSMRLRFHPGVDVCVLPEDDMDKDYPRKYGLKFIGQIGNAGPDQK